jgi:hypothetical protein
MVEKLRLQEEHIGTPFQESLDTVLTEVRQGPHFAKLDKILGRYEPSEELFDRFVQDRDDFPDRLRYVWNGPIPQKISALEAFSGFSLLSRQPIDTSRTVKAQGTGGAILRELTHLRFDKVDYKGRWTREDAIESVSNVLRWHRNRFRVNDTRIEQGASLDIPHEFWRYGWSNEKQLQRELENDEKSGRALKGSAEWFGNVVSYAHLTKAINSYPVRNFLLQRIEFLNDLNEAERMLAELNEMLENSDGKTDVFSFEDR